jgi:hypothetical protein
MADTTNNGPQQGDVFFGAEAGDADDEDNDFSHGVEKKPAAVTPEMAVMNSKLEAMSAAMEKLQQANMMLMAGGPPPAQFTPPPAAPVEVELPDPVDDPKGYADALRKQIMSELSHAKDVETQAAVGQQKEQAKYGELWDEFQIKHADYSKDFKKVRYAANIVAENAQKRGLDMNKYMFTYRDQFMADVVKEMNSIFGMEDSGKQYVNEDNRTDGIFGGRPQQAPAAVKEDGPDDDPFKDIREFQIRHGFHR